MNPGHIYLLKYEIYIPLNKLFSQTARIRNSAQGGVCVSVLRRISNTFCMAIICLLGPLSTLTYHFHSLEKCSTVSPFALSFLLCFNNLSQHVAGRCPSYSTLFTASVAVVLSAPLTTHGHSLLVCGVWRTCNVNMTTPTRRPLPTYVMSSHASTVQLS